MFSSIVTNLLNYSQNLNSCHQKQNLAFVQSILNPIHLYFLKIEGQKGSKIHPIFNFEHNEVLMTYKSVFDEQVTKNLIERAMNINADTKPGWGKMNAGQLFAHLNVPYDMIYTGKYKKASGITKLMMKLFVKKVVVGPKPYKKNNQTAPAFLIKDERDFQAERTKLIDYLKTVQQGGQQFFEGRESNSFGVLTVDEWNTLMYKHLDHHFTQFGV